MREDLPGVPLRARAATATTPAQSVPQIGNQRLRPNVVIDHIRRENHAEAMLRRQAADTASERMLVFDDLKLDTWSNVVERAGQQITLTAKEYTLLELFMRNPNKVLSREYIATQVWGIDFDTGTNFIDVYVNYLRKKIEKGFKKKLIHTVIGMGYTLRNDR